MTINERLGAATIALTLLVVIPATQAQAPERPRYERSTGDSVAGGFARCWRYFGCIPGNIRTHAPDNTRPSLQ